MDTTKPQAWVIGLHTLPDLTLELQHSPHLLAGSALGSVLLLESGRWTVLSRAEFDRLYEWE